MRNTLPESEPAAPFKNGQSMMQELQQALKQNPNDAKDWFRLGQLYMQSSEFDAAITCFDYSIRLSETPYAGQYAAIATAKYFDESQTITPEVQQFLDKAFEMDEYNDTALLLVASDYFLHSEHNKAIEIWTKILDSNRPGIDRAAIIEKINQAKRMSGN
jgi:formate-dependent nitrite reductase complex subunit NrfG